jgi:hypothetical protein
MNGGPGVPKKQEREEILVRRLAQADGSSRLIDRETADRPQQVPIGHDAAGDLSH